jgi:putative membrane protein
MKKFALPEFQTQLGKLIAELERASQIEVVIMIKKQSANYEDLPWCLGGLLSLLSLAILYFSDTDIEGHIVLLTTFDTFGLGVLLGFIPLIRRLLITKKRKQRNVEIMARALFQKGGLHHTSAKTGTLVYVSVLEQQVYIVADRGAEMAIPAAEWQQINNDLAEVFKDKNPSQALLTELAKCKNIFHRYIPALENKVNELPNDLQVEL